MKFFTALFGLLFFFTAALDAQQSRQSQFGNQQTLNDNGNNDEPIPPPKPTLRVVPGDGEVLLYWDEVAESHHDPYFETINRNPDNFQGYKVYKSTDPGFLSALRITDNQGNLQRLAPEAIFDLQNEITGYHPASINGSRVFVGNDTGLQRTYRDDQVMNGRVYYYAVVSFTHGDAMPNFELPVEFDDDGNPVFPFPNEVYTVPPLESGIDITVEDDGRVITGINTVKVMPRKASPGYVEPLNPTVERVRGSAGGEITVDIIDPNLLQGGNNYQIVFEDTIIPGGVGRPDLPATKNFSLINTTTGEAIFDKVEDFRGIPLPIREGFQLTLTNAGDTVQVNPDLSQWVTDQPDPIHQFDFSIATRFPQLADYRVEFYDEVVRQSEAYSFEVGGQPINLPVEDVTFRVFNTTTGEEIDFAFFANPLVPRDFRRVQFVNENVGYAAGGAGIIQKTTDGGENWEILTSGSNARFNGMYFVNENTGWVVGREGTILQTTDGGDVWEAQTTQTDKRLLDVYFVDENRGWAVGEEGAIVRTTNGGNTWTTISSGTLRNLNSVYFTDENNGWIVGFVTVLRTTDGGQTWQPETIGPARGFTSVYFTDSQNGWITGNTSVSEVFRTTDGGQNWQQIPVSIFGAGFDMTQIRMLNNNFGYITGTQGRMARTNDGGQTWTQLNTETSNSLFSVGIIDQNRAWAVGNNAVRIQTNDGGSNWDRAINVRRFRAFIDETGNTRSDEIYFLEDFSGNTGVDTWKVSMLVDPRGTSVDPAGGDVLELVTIKPFTSADEYRFSVEADNQPTEDPELARDRLGDIRVVPNPYLVTHIAETANPDGSRDNQLHFTNLPSQCTIRIFSVSGRLLQTINVNNPIDNDRYIWDMRTKDNSTLPYGVYIYHVSAPGIGEKVGKFAVIK